MVQGLCVWVWVLASSWGSAAWLPAPAAPAAVPAPGALAEALFSRRCPSYCSCGAWRGLRRADCAERRILSVDLGLPREVEVADLGGNLITVLEDGCFQEQGLVQLCELNLRRNAIRSIGLFAFVGLRRLSALDLSHNHLQNLHPNTFDGNRGLKVLLLAGNNFARLAPDRPVLSAPHLQVLDLSQCKLPYLGPAMFAELPALASLNLSANYLNQLQPAVFQSLARLQVLDADKNPFNCDLSTNEFIGELRARNVSVSHPCPAMSAPSKHLARLLADVVPGVVEEVEPVVESIDVGWEKVGRSEKMQDLDSLLGLMRGPLVADSSDEREGLEIDERYDENRSATNADCAPSFSSYESGNPEFFKEFFDQIPSFWASLLGFQVGLFVTAVLTCAIRTCCCRDLCRDRRRLARRSTASSADSAIGRDYVALGDSASPTPTISRAAAGLLWAGERSSAETDTRGDRPETPPPAYDEVMWTASARPSVV